jgi:hypothetical protein
LAAFGLDGAFSTSCSDLLAPFSRNGDRAAQARAGARHGYGGPSRRDPSAGCANAGGAACRGRIISQPLRSLGSCDEDCWAGSARTTSLTIADGAPAPSSARAGGRRHCQLAADRAGSPHRDLAVTWNRCPAVSGRVAPNMWFAPSRTTSHP